MRGLCVSGCIIACLFSPNPHRGSRCGGRRHGDGIGVLNLATPSSIKPHQPHRAVTAAIEMLRVESDVVDIGPPPAIRTRGLYRRPMDRRIAPLFSALSDRCTVFNRQLPTGNPALCAQARRRLPERYPRIS